METQHNTMQSSSQNTLKKISQQEMQEYQASIREYYNQPSFKTFIPHWKPNTTTTQTETTNRWKKAEKK